MTRLPVIIAAVSVILSGLAACGMSDQDRAMLTQTRQDASTAAQSAANSAREAAESARNADMVRQQAGAPARSTAPTTTSPRF